MDSEEKTDPALTPVIIGVGECNDRPPEGERGLDSAQLMASALVAAACDAGHGDWIGAIERLHVVPQISWRDIDVPASLAAQTGIPVERIVQAEEATGDSPTRLLDVAAEAIRRGELSVAAVTGGEALRNAARRTDRPPQPLFSGSARVATDLRRRYGLLVPADIYPLYENAWRAQQGQSLEQGQAESGAIWAAMSEVAATSQGAWLRTPRSAGEIVEATPANRLIAFPYTKLMVANSSVNQGAAVIVCSLAHARAAGVPDDRLVYVGAGAAAHEPDEALARAAFVTPPGMQVTLERVLPRNGLTIADVEHVELYSCFPCVPKMARAVLGWPEDRSVTVHGGLTFGGGPIANYMGHAIAAMVRKIREGARNGLLFGNGGYCSHNHAIVLRGSPVKERAGWSHDGDQAEADARRGSIPALTDVIEGELPVETYTVVYDREGEPKYGVVLSRSPSGERVIAQVPPEDARSLAWLTSGNAEPVGALGRNRRVGETLIWSAPTR